MSKDIYQEVHKNYEWFQKNENLIKEHPDKIGYYALLKNQNVVCFYKNYEEVTIVANAKFKDDPFSIQQLEEKEKIHNLGNSTWIV